MRVEIQEIENGYLVCKDEKIFAFPQFQDAVSHIMKELGLLPVGCSLSMHIKPEAVDGKP